MRQLSYLVAGTMICITLSTNQAQAQDCVTMPLDCKYTRPKNGIVIESTTHLDVNVEIRLTNSFGEDIPGVVHNYDKFGDQTQFPKRLNFGTGGLAVQSDPVKIPIAVLNDATGKATLVDDIHQITTIVKNSGEINDLMIEAVYRDTDTGSYALGNIFGAIFDRFGTSKTIWIPDLYSDTNNDGVIGPGDYLYSLVDINVFMEHDLNFALDDVFSIVNGTVAELPGMMFSTAPFTFDPTSGWTTTGGDYSDTAVASTLHGAIPAVPEPSAWALLVGGFGLSGLALRRARRSSRGAFGVRGAVRATRCS